MNFNKETMETLSDEELFQKFNEESESFKALPEIDKRFALVQQAIAATHAYNMLETQIRSIAIDVTECLPDAPREVVKIITSRCDDINPNEIDNLSNGFITQLLTVDGKTYKLTCSDKIKSQLPEGIEELDSLNFKRAALMSFKTASENIATWNAWAEKLRRAVLDRVSDEVKKIIATPDTLEDYMTNYYRFKSTDPNVPEELRKRFVDIVKWNEYAYTLEPIIESLKNTIRKSGSTNSILYGFANNARVVFRDADKACKANGFNFPPHILNINIEKDLLGEPYDKYPFLTQYLIARYVKYVGTDMTKNEKVFITQLFTEMMYLVRMKDKDDKTCNKVVAKLLAGVKQMLDTVIQNK